MTRPSRALLSCVFVLLCVWPRDAAAQDSGTLTKVANTVCACLSKIDMSAITTKDQATAAFMTCFVSNAAGVIDLARERKLDFSDQAAMKALGLEVGKELLVQGCTSFVQLSVKMAGAQTPNGVNVGNSEVTAGRLVRVDNREFRYLVVADAANRENTFIWLRYFKGSEKFIEIPDAYIGKPLKIQWQETEVFLPSAKGYFKLKEITGIEVQ
jgi:hypothetical protein